MFYAMASGAVGLLIGLWFRSAIIHTQNQTIDALLIDLHRLRAKNMEYAIMNLFRGDRIVHVQANSDEEAWQKLLGQ